MQIPWKGDLKSGKSSVSHARNCSFVRRGLRQKVPFLVSSTKLAEVVQDIAFDACVEMHENIQQRSEVCVEVQENASHDVCVEVQESIQQRSMTYVLTNVWKCKNTYYGAEVEQNIKTPPHPSPHQHAKISTYAWPFAGVDTANMCIYIYTYGQNTQTKHIERLWFSVKITSWCPKFAAKNPPVLSQASSRAASRSCSGPGSPRAMARRKRSFALKVSTSSGFFNLSTWEVGGVTKGYTLPVRWLIVQYQYSCNNHTNQ